MTRHITLKGVVFSSIVVALFGARTTSLPFTKWMLLALSAGTCLWVIYRSFVYPFYFSPMRHIPTVSGRWAGLTSHLPQRLSKEMGAAERDWHLAHGPIVRYFILPLGVERLAVADLEAIKDINLRYPYRFAKPQRVINWMKPVLGEKGILLVNGDVHVRQRKALAPGFSTSAIRNLEPQFWDKCLQLREILSHNVLEQGQDASVEILEYLNRTTLDIIGRVAFAFDVDSLIDPNVPLRAAYSRMFAFDITSCVSQAVAMYLPWTRRIPTQMNRDTARSGKVISDTAGRIVESKLDEDEESFAPLSKDILSLVVRQNESLIKDDGDKLSFDEIRDQVMNFLGAGHDTTATGVAWTIDLLSKHSHVQDKLREEIIANFPLLTQSEIDPHWGGSTLADLNLLDRLPYLANACNESLRFIPPVPIVSRECVEDTTLGGYFVPRGTNLFISSNAVNQLPWFWGPTAGVFDPDRWNNLPKEWAPGAYQTFLEGPRGCIGRKFAETEMKVLLCCLLSKFKFERDESWPDQEEVKNWRIVLRPRDGIQVKVRFVDESPAAP